jgi:hypothetical protein
MALSYLDIGIDNIPQLLVLNNGVPYGIQNTNGLTLFGASVVSALAGTANQVTVSNTGGSYTISIPAAFVAPGSVSATTRVNAPSYVKASLPAVGAAGGMIYVSDATGAHVTGSLAFSNGTSWIDVTTGVAVA